MVVVEDPGGASATETALLAQILVTPKHGGGSGDEVADAFGSATVREHGRVFEAGADAVSAGKGAEVDRPRRDAVAMVDLFKGHASIGERLFDCRRVLDGGVRIGVERLDHRADAARGDACGYEALCVIQRQQPGLDADPSGHQELTPLHNAALALVGGHQVRQLGPSLDERKPPPRVGHDVSGGAQRVGYTVTGLVTTVRRTRCLQGRSIRPR